MKGHIMPNLNRATIMGHLGQDPELRHTQNGKAVLNLSIATTKGKDENKRTEWHRAVVWGINAEKLSSQCKKGDVVYVDGELQTRSWEKDGTKHYTTEIQAWTAYRIDYRKTEKPAESVQEPSEPVDDIPF